MNSKNLVNKLAITFASISYLLLAAHALRQSELGMMVAWLLAFPLLTIRTSWSRYILISGLILGSLVWIKTSILLISLRMAMAEPWVRLLCILAGVYLLALVSALLLTSHGSKGYFCRGSNNTQKYMVFMLITSTLCFLQAKLSFPILLSERFIPGSGWFMAPLFGFYGMWVLHLLLESKKTSHIRLRIWSFFSFVFFLQLCLGLLGIEEMLMTGKLHLPIPALIIAGPLFRGEGFFMISLFLCTVLFLGPAWCSYLCYIGSWDGLFAQSKKTKPLPRWTNWLRAGLFFLVILIALFLRMIGATTALALIIASLFGIVGLLVMVLFSRIMGVMVHCSVYCPIGLLGNLLGKLLPWKIVIDDGCTECGKCSKACRYNALQDTHIKKRKVGLSCTLCGDCLGRCKEQIITYGFFNVQPDTARHIFLVLVAAFHGVFLAVARI